MAIYRLKENRIFELTQTTFANETIDEAKNLQKFIINSIHCIEKGLFVISCEYGNWEDSKRRIDILCIDKSANLVVIELKRTEDGGHMELQSIRYAAMVSNMTFENVVEAYEDYLTKNDRKGENPQQNILNFLEWDEIYEEKFALEVRIILVSANFSKEITTSVLWLIDRDVDIKCIKLKPQKDGENIYLDIQQIIPLPEATDYQVKLREKVAEQRQSIREGSRDYSKFDVSINGKTQHDLNKRQTMHFVISESVKFGISPEDLIKITGSKRWISVKGIHNNAKDFETSFLQTGKNYDASRWFNSDEELIHFGTNTYLFSNQNGKETHDIVRGVFDAHKDLNGTIEKKVR